MTLPALDFETFSAAGYIWNPETQKFGMPPGARRKGLPAINAVAYSEHPSTEVLTLSYDLLDGHGVRRWRPGQALPHDLFEHLAAGRLIEAHNAMFERLIWANVCVPRYGFPPMPFYALRCSAAKARVSSYPPALGNLSDVLRLTNRKNADGKRLLDKFSMPRNPTKSDSRWRILPTDDPDDFERLCTYCDDDVAAEIEASGKTPELSADETLFWMVDQEINWRGIAIDRAGVRDCIAVLEQALVQYGAEFRALTGLDATQLEATKGWLAAQGVYLYKMDEESIDEALTRIAPHPPGGQSPARRALEIRQLIGSASVKKLFAMENQASRDDRLRNLIIHHGARTGRPTGDGPQPLNLPRAGPDLRWCDACGLPHRHDVSTCPWCAAPSAAKPRKWSPAAVDTVLGVMATRDLATVERYFGDALLCISGCLRGLFVAGPGLELIASDYSAIEAVVIAMLAGEQWRIQAFREKQPIYLLSASKITGTPLEEYLAYFEEHGDHHPDRQKIGKVAELANGFGGWIGSNKAFGSTEPDDVIKAQIIAWRAASPAIVDLWGGQKRGAPWDERAPTELFGYEGMAIAAIQNPGTTYDWRGVQFTVRPTPATGPALYVRLLSGRELTYHAPELRGHDRWPGLLKIIYWTWNSNPKYGALGWGPMETYGGRLTENIVQATAHDIQRFGILALRAAGYHTVLHVYDENVAEVPLGAGSIDEFERIMSTMPPWAHDWPIHAAGGWRGRRYRKG